MDVGDMRIRTKGIAVTERAGGSLVRHGLGGDLVKEDEEERGGRQQHPKMMATKGSLFSQRKGGAASVQKLHDTV